MPFPYPESQPDLWIDLPWRQFQNMVISSPLFQKVLPPFARPNIFQQEIPEAHSYHGSTSSSAFVDSLITRPKSEASFETPKLEFTGDFGRLLRTLAPRHAQLLSEVIAWFLSARYTEPRLLLGHLKAAMREGLLLPFKLLFQANSLAVRAIGSSLLRDGDEETIHFLISAGISKSHFVGHERKYLMRQALVLHRYDDATILLKQGVNFGSVMVDLSRSLSQYLLARILLRWFRDASVFQYLLDHRLLVSEESKAVVMMASTQIL